MDFKNTLLVSLNSAWIIIKLVIPIYILAEVLFFYNTLSYFSFLIEPFTSVLDLPKEASLAILSGMFLNLYAAIAFAAAAVAAAVAASAAAFAAAFVVVTWY